MSTPSIHCIAIALLVVLPGVTRGQAATPQRPNVIFILADDLGYGDLGFTYQNSRDPSKPRFATPQIDRMAAEGMFLRQHYTGAPVCASARGSLLLGQHQGNCPIRDNQFDKALPNNHTLATVLKAAGYHTVCIGKWGLQGKKPEYTGHPMRHGYDEFFGFLAHVSGHTYYHDASKPLHEGYTDVTAQYSDVYSTDLFTARAKKFITEHTAAKPDEPFFISLNYTAVHNMLNVPDSPYPAGGGKSGGLQWPIKPHPEMKNKWIFPDYANATSKGANGATVKWTEPMKRYATMARRLDDGVGDILQLLRDLKIDGNTLVVFTSDNGPANENGSDPRLFDSWGPFDGLKRDCWEGGVREPTIAWWPGHVPAGRTSDFVSGFWDWMPTLANAAGLVSPANSDGVSLLPTLTGSGQQRSKGYLYVEYFVKSKNPVSADVFKRKGVTGRGQQQIIRIGDYVGVRTQIKSATDPLRLYNVITDPHEDHNLAGDAASEGRLAQMRELLATLHRPEPDAKRPYDDQPMPAVSVAAVTPGALEASTYQGQWKWVPDLDALKPISTTRTKGFDLASHNEQIGIKFTGYLKAPQDGEYTFYVTSDSGAEMWLHEGHVIDDDFNHDGSEVTAKVHLQAGLHPIRLFYRHRTGPSRLEVKWSGPGIDKQAIPAAALAVAADPAQP